MTRVTISLYNLTIQIEAELAYPDQINDLCNRASFLYMTTIAAAKENGLKIDGDAIIEEIEGDF